MSEYICTAKIKYTRQEIQLHINALKTALSNPQFINYRGRYEKLLRDMIRIEEQMLEKERTAVINRDKQEQVVEDSVVNDA
tara:strand:- start:8011 stop:8253 length:243 start_codon:yes stop_codon:yes gene_type:complete